MKTLNNWRSKRSSSRVSRLARSMQPMFDTLEDRRMLSLLGVAPGYPQILVNSSTGISYNFNSTTSNAFVVATTPVQITTAAGNFPDSITNGNLSISFNVNNNGQIIPGQSGPNLILTGTATNLLT